jgi:hypothetical protein
MTSIVILVELESDSTELVRYISEQSMTTRKPNLQQGHREFFLKIIKIKKKLNPKPKRKLRAVVQTNNSSNIYNLSNNRRWRNPTEDNNHKSNYSIHNNQKFNNSIHRNHRFKNSIQTM